jgi:hypothetical protein
MIQALISLTLSNALGALALAVATVVVTRFVRAPALAHALWILVLVKLVSPAMVELPVRLPGDRPLLALRAPEETADSPLRIFDRRDSATLLPSAEIANDHRGTSFFSGENAQSVSASNVQLFRPEPVDLENAEPNRFAL